MHEIPELKKIMRERAVNKLKWYEFKIQEVYEQNKQDGLFDTNILVDLGLPSPILKDNNLACKNKKNGKNQQYILDDEGQYLLKEEQKTQENNEIYSPIVVKQRMICRTASELMIPFAKKHLISREINDKKLNIKSQQIQGESSRGYDKIEVSLRNKEQIQEIIERNCLNNGQINCSPKRNQKEVPTEQNSLDSASHLMKQDNWFDIQKKKELEQKIFEAIQIRRNSSNRIVKSKQKSVVSVSDYIIETPNNGNANLSLLPTNMQRKVLKYKQERDKCQFNDYINYKTEIDQQVDQTFSSSQFKSLHQPVSSKTIFPMTMDTINECGHHTIYYSQTSIDNQVMLSPSKCNAQQISSMSNSNRFYLPTNQKYSSSKFNDLTSIPYNRQNQLFMKPQFKGGCKERSIGLQPLNINGSMDKNINSVFGNATRRKSLQHSNQHIEEDPILENIDTYQLASDHKQIITHCKSKSLKKNELSFCGSSESLESGLGTLKCTPRPKQDSKQDRYLKSSSPKMLIITNLATKSQQNLFKVKKNLISIDKNDKFQYEKRFKTFNQESLPQGSLRKNINSSHLSSSIHKIEENTLLEVSSFQSASRKLIPLEHNNKVYKYIKYLTDVREQPHFSRQSNEQSTKSTLNTASFLKSPQDSRQKVPDCISLQSTLLKLSKF